MSYAVEVENLRVRIGGFEVLRDLTFKVPENTIFTVMGPSGSGKSTLLRVINRLIDLIPEAEVSGRVVVLGRDVFKADPYRLRTRIGMVFQTPNPFPHLSIYENVALGPKLNGLVKSKKELDNLVRWALEKAMLWEEVKDKLDVPPLGLSGGQQQRLCIARALAMRPELLLLDEPTANVDPINARKIEDVLISFRREGGVTIMMVTHSPPQASRVSDYIAFIYMGQLVEVGPADQVFVNPRNKLTERFLRGEVS